jgi:hypothetical protein
MRITKNKSNRIFISTTVFILVYDTLNYICIFTNFSKR